MTELLAEVPEVDVTSFGEETSYFEPVVAASSSIVCCCCS
ncbi:hypothetical protein JOM49_005767 [Amycolatopsis magusensis]|uniref:Thiazolylpeptide-type bacteriocin n=1 Tax=Amycolatopsis magusensis TaxID=882444 RepID=A0ABS4Q072_9PSEU|nr:hypothetical protein [Amycolatopsis magusensis]